ncbi:MAG: phosphatidylinositol-specific phospholipase C/glycerophosphodiester phosphodiesterase family protein [Chitinophagales bacterium]|nr:phosphatidylinositol-specific phospholipase C/glycerophosphodiester phosphodiesterase family protein [Chitinophagales bacterium]
MKFLPVLLLLALFSLPTFAQYPLVLQGHAHNDYKHKRPLLDALDAGFMSVEADVFLRDGKILVAHTVVEIKQKNTLQRLYLDPLKERIKQNGGKVYAKGPMEFELMIDLKDGGPEMMKALREQLAPYQDMLTVYKNGVKTTGAVRIVLSGGQSPHDFKNDTLRLFSSDGGLPNFDTALDSSLVPRVSASYRDLFTWKGKGEMPAAEKQQLQEMMDRAKQYGRKSRLWATPNVEAVWKEQMDAGQYWINVDDLKGFRKFYLKYTGQKEGQ